MEEKSKILKEFFDSNIYISKDWIIENVLGLNPVLVDRKQKLDKIYGNIQQNR